MGFAAYVAFEVALWDPGCGPRCPQCPKRRGWLRSKLLKNKLVTEEDCKNEYDYFAYLGFPLTLCFFILDARISS